MTARAIPCSSCGEGFRVLAQQAGRAVRCPHCRKQQAIPADLFKAEEPPSTSAFRADEPVEQAAVATRMGSAKGPTTRIGEWYRSSREFQYSHSTLASRLDAVAVLLFILASCTQVYVLLTAEWSTILSLPLTVAIPVIVVLFVAGGTIAVLALFLMAAAHGVEYLARLASRS